MSNCNNSRRANTTNDDSSICGRHTCLACGEIKGTIISDSSLYSSHNSASNPNTAARDRFYTRNLDFDDRQPLLSKSIDATTFAKRKSSDIIIKKAPSFQHPISNATGETSKKRQGCCLRYFVCCVVILAIAMNNYANLTLNISTIAMISSDVLQSGLTELRAEHMSADPLAVGRDAALPGTCPSRTISQSQDSQNVSSLALQTGTNDANPINNTLLSQIEVNKMSHDAAHLLADVNARLAAGELVDWSISQRGLIYTAHNVGGIVMALPVGYFAIYYGAKIAISVGIITTALRMLLLPLVASHAPFWLALVFEFVFGGPGQTISLVFYPIAAAWLLPNEANAFVAFIQIANLAGNSATNFITGQMLSSGINWCYCFYLPGIVVSVLAVLWLVLGTNHPEDSRFISQGELELLKFSLHNLDKIKHREQTLAARDSIRCVCDTPAAKQYQQNGLIPSDKATSIEPDECPARQMRRKPDWNILFKCPVVWSMVAASFASHWCRKLRTTLPTYLSNVMHLDAATVGMVIGLQGVCAAIFGSGVIYATRKLVSKPPFGITLTAYRRVNQVIATTFLGITIAMITIFDCDIAAHIVYATLTPLVTSFDGISYDQMPLDISVEDSGLLASVVRMIGIGDIVALPISSKILASSAKTDLPSHLQTLSGDRYTWRLVWFVTLGFKVVACVWFVLFARSDPKSYSHLEPVGACKSLKKPAAAAR